MTHNKTGIFNKFRYLFLVAVLSFGLIAVIGSGGGGDGDSDTTTGGGGGGTTPVELPTIGGTIYNSAQAVGDLLQVAFNPATLEYGYTFIEPADGGSGTGTLSLMTGYTQYVYQDEYGMPVIVFPDNVFIAIPGGGDEGLLVGVPSLTTAYTASEIAGVYNFVQLAGTGGDLATYEGNYGTFKVNADGTWESWDEGDLTSNTDIGGNAKDSGTWEDQGNGIVYAYRSGTKIANVMIHPDYAGNAAEKVLLLDINDGDFKGIMLGVKQQALTSGSADGTYTLVESDEENLFEITVAGNTVTHPDGMLPITYNSPWTGFVYGDDGTLVLMLPSGIFFGGGEDADSAWVFAGIKK